jgi:hypothetical protein
MPECRAVQPAHPWRTPDGKKGKKKRGLPMTQLFEVSVEEKIAALRREIELRIRVYGRYVTEGKMTKTKADRELEIMQAILKDYEQGTQP